MHPPIIYNGKEVKKAPAFNQCEQVCYYSQEEKNKRKFPQYSG